ncbi:MAG: hypothetical protein LH702_16540 [Phormidesmis sp. CAN_BIN44]|nr:hypothetical protein [Phormidesmis sp. CAN_BIN44]
MQESLPAQALLILKRSSAASISITTLAIPMSKNPLPILQKCSNLANFLRDFTEFARESSKLRYREQQI